MGDTAVHLAALLSFVSNGEIRRIARTGWRKPQFMNGLIVAIGYMGTGWVCQTILDRMSLTADAYQVSRWGRRLKAAFELRAEQMQTVLV